jgi:hypothetical protein
MYTNFALAMMDMYVQLLNPQPTCVPIQEHNLCRNKYECSFSGTQTPTTLEGDLAKSFAYLEAYDE